jgi:hypothetical protein
VSLEIDLQPLWDSINANLPTFFGVFAAIGGISVAISLALFLIGEVKKAFRA